MLIVIIATPTENCSYRTGSNDRSSLVPSPHKLDQRVIDVLRMRGTQEMLAVLDSHELGGGGVDEEFNLLLRVGDGIDRVVGTLDARGLN